MSGAGPDSNRRKLAVMLSALALTPDDALAIFRARRAADRELDPQELRRARLILDAIGNAILDRNPERWQRLREASRLLEQDALRPPTELEQDASHASPMPDEVSARGAEDRVAADPSRPDESRAPASPPTPTPPVRPAPAPLGAERAASPWLNAPPASGERAPSPPPPAVAEPPAGPGVLDGTMPIGASVQAVFKTLPFKSPARPSADEADTRAIRLRTRAHRALPFDKVEDETPGRAATPCDEPQGAGVTAPSPPEAVPSQPASAPAVELTLEQYASFCAERTVCPERVAEVWVRYRLRDEAEVLGLDQRWRARFDADVELGARFARAHEHYCAWLRGRRAP